MRWTDKSRPSQRRVFGGRHRFEHWYRDNQVYFITARCTEGVLALESTEARSIFWTKFEQYTTEHGFVPWVTTLIGNHYHTLGYLKLGRELGELMRKFHGSVAKLVNDVLEREGTERLRPFWGAKGRQDYFDGCIRDEVQCRRAYRYTLTQSVRHKLCADWRSYPDTRVNVELDPGVRRAVELGAFLYDVPYRRYQRRDGLGH
jgi:hypothetical protein